MFLTENDAAISTPNSCDWDWYYRNYGLIFVVFPNGVTAAWNVAGPAGLIGMTGMTEEDLADMSLEAFVKSLDRLSRTNNSDDRGNIDVWTICCRALQVMDNANVYLKRSILDSLSKKDRFALHKANTHLTNWDRKSKAANLLTSE